MQDRDAVPGLLPSPGSNVPQRADADRAREWLFPGADEWFRTIYSRAIGAGEAIAISSAIAGEGKTTVSIGVASTLAEDYPSRRIVLVETDLQKPVLKGDFGFDEAPGLANWLEGSRAWEEACRPTTLPNLDVLPAGLATRQNGRLLRSSRMPRLIDKLREAYDVVVLDSLAFLANTDAELIAELADGVILVVRAGLTPTPLINKALELVEPAKLRGVVLNDSHSRVPRWLRGAGS